jgi:prophage tail gpP-like protein
MSNPAEIATITTAGGTYSYWKSIEIERTVGDPVSYMKFSAAEPGIGAGETPSWGTLQLMPGDAAQGYLAGQLAITGVVETRQSSNDPKNHGVEIIVASYTQNGVASTVDANPGQYLNQTISQIANAVYGKVGVSVNVDGASGANLPFERVSEHVGETRNAFIQRLAMMRNLHMVDDANGALNLIRGETAGSTTLVEGQNILKGRILLRNQLAVSLVNLQAQNFGNNTHNGSAAAQVNVQVPNPSYTGSYRPYTIMAEMPTDQAGAQLRANHELNLNDLQICEALITVPGWLMDDGTLWINHLREAITINSPMLIPNNPFTLLLRGVKHLQDSEEGTRTELNLCIPRGIGSGLMVDIGNAPPGT